MKDILSAHDVFNMIVEFIHEKGDMPPHYLASHPIDNRFGEMTVGELDRAFREDRVSHIDDVLLPEYINAELTNFRDFLLRAGLAEFNPDSMRNGLRTRHPVRGYYGVAVAETEDAPEQAPAEPPSEEKKPAARAAPSYSGPAFARNNTHYLTSPGDAYTLSSDFLLSSRDAAGAKKSGPRQAQGGNRQQRRAAASSERKQEP